MRVAARFAPRFGVAAMAATVRWTRRTPQRWRASGARWAPLHAICGVFFALSTRPPSRLRPRAKPMATKTIRVDYLTRIEGEGGLDLRISDGRVTSAQLKIFEPPRFFEAFLRGRGYVETPDLV